MTLDEAINVMTDILTFVKPGDPPEEHQALELGIQAIRRIQAIRITDRVERITRLPGETE